MSKAGNTVVILPDRNHHRKDFAGAFLPEAERFIKHHAVVGGPQLVDISKPMPLRGVSVTKILSAATSPVDTIAFFCHGYTKGMQLGFTRQDVGKLAAVITAASTKAVRVIFYSCSVGSWIKGTPGGDGGFADLLRDALCTAGAVDCQVDAHTTAGHTTMNPHVRRFCGRGTTSGGIGGEWLVGPGTDLWNRWRTALASTPLRFDFPFMTTGEIHDWLLNTYKTGIKDAA